MRQWLKWALFIWELNTAWGSSDNTCQVSHGTEASGERGCLRIMFPKLQLSPAYLNDKMKTLIPNIANCLPKGSG